MKDSITTAGLPQRLALTVFTGPDGLQADGSDVAFIDFEIVDANGARCPTAEKRVNFKITGPAIWRGGNGSRIVDSVDKLHLDAECGVKQNRHLRNPAIQALTRPSHGLLAVA